jgi:prevent-host-death family protein
MSQYNIAEAKAHLNELLEKAILGEDIVICRNNKPLVRLMPIEAFRMPREPGSAKREIIAIAPDFDNTPASCQDYT